MKVVFDESGFYQNCISNAEQVKDFKKKFKPGNWTFLGPGRKPDGTATLTMVSGIAQPTGWYKNRSSHLRKYQRFESWSLEA